MNLTPRLTKIINLLPNVEILADVGCDHGIVGVNALLQGKAKKIIFTDISKPSLKKAEILAENFGIADRCEFVFGDGLVGRTVDCAVVAGMGGKEIIKIIDDCSHKPSYLLLNPMRNTDTVRQKLMQEYFIDYDEKFFDKKFYDILMLSSGKDNLSQLEIKFGKTNLEFFCEDFCNYLREERLKYVKILENTNNSQIEAYLKEIESLLYRSKNAG